MKLGPFRSSDTTGITERKLNCHSAEYEINLNISSPN